MSLKNIILKTGAASIAVSIIFSNCSMFGLGLSKVIAENIQAPKIEANLTSPKYVQYQTEEYSGVAIQTELEVSSIQEQEGYLPVLDASLEVELPNINGYLPERASVVKASTEATTGEKENTNINQNYDSNSGLLTVSYENIQNSDGNIYTEFKKDAKDKFEIIYIYPAEAYTGNEEEIALQYTVNAKMAFKTENEKITSEKTKSFEIKEKENKGDITTFNVTELKENIYKGFMYSNVENKTNYNTEYKTVSTLCVLNSQFVNETTMELKESKFVLNDEEKTEVTTNGTVIYKSTGISKAEFDKILGQDGSLEIYNGETLVATVKYIEVEENKKTVKKLAVVYSEEDIKILSDEETSAIVEYKEDVTALTIKTSKPIAEGFMNFENQNTIKAAKEYGVDVKDIKYIRTATNVNTYESKTDIQLLEPETKISVNSSNTNFSTLQTSKTTLKIKLDDTNSSTKLFNNPTITIKLPNGLTRGKLSSPEILNGNGLSIKSAKADNNVITIELEGKQTSYDLNNVSGGVNIVMDIENIDFNDKIPTHKDKIEVACLQGSNKVTTSCDVNINSKYGLLMLSETTGYDSNNNITTNTDSQIKEISISDNEQAKELVQALTLVNNYGEDLNNIQIIGRIGYTNGDISSTFDTNLTKPITINKEGAKVYYSNNKEASYEDNSWTEEFTTDAKSYKVVLNNNKLSKMETATIKIYVQVPEKLGYNQATYLRTEANYIYNNQNRSDSSTIKMATDINQLSKYRTTVQQNLTNDNGDSIPISVSVTPSIKENYVHANQLLTYKIKIENTSNTDLNAIKIDDIIPENAIYTYNKIVAGNTSEYYELTEDTEIKQKQIYTGNLKANEAKEFEIMLTTKNVTEEQELLNKIIVTYNEETVTNESKILLKPSEIATRLTTKRDYMINPIYGTGEIVEYIINVKNVTDKSLKNVKVQYEVPTYLKYEQGGLGKYDEFTGYSIDKEGELNNNQFSYVIDKLDKQEEKNIVIRCKVEKIPDLYQANIENIATVILENEKYETNLKTIQTKQAAYTISLTSDASEKELKAGDSVTYTAKVKNIGKAGGSVQVNEQVPSEIEVNKVEYAKENEEMYKIETNKQSISISNYLEEGETLTVKITGKVKEIETTDEEILEINCVAKLVSGAEEMSSNNVLLKVKTILNNKVDLGDNDDLSDLNHGLDNDNDNDSNIDNPNNDNSNENNSNNQENNNNDNQNNNENNNESNTVENNLHTISGIAWLDSNKNGQRDSEEKLLESVIVTLINKETGNFATDETGNKITATTNSNGEYKFENIKEGTYIVLFEFDANTYTLTTYQKAGVEQNVNSDAIISNVTINGEKKLAGITDNIVLDADKVNTDIGLIENAIFDLSLDKAITKVTVTNSQGTQEFNYKNGETAKVDLVAKYINTATVIVNYKFTITNNGDTVGYVDSLVDNLPSGLEFSSELNKDWYKGSDGQLYTTSLSGIAIKPGETSEVELILTKNMTENNTGTFVNNAELEKISNLENVQEKTEALENNKSSAILILSIKTGSVMLYTGITVACILILAAGTYIIKKKILDRGI